MVSTSADWRASEPEGLGPCMTEPRRAWPLLPFRGRASPGLCQRESLHRAVVLVEHDLGVHISRLKGVVPRGTQRHGRLVLQLEHQAIAIAVDTALERLRRIPP